MLEKRAIGEEGGPGRNAGDHMYSTSAGRSSEKQVENSGQLTTQEAYSWEKGN